MSEEATIVIEIGYRTSGNPFIMRYLVTSKEAKSIAQSYGSVDANGRAQQKLSFTGSPQQGGSWADERLITVRLADVLFIS